MRATLLRAGTALSLCGMIAACSSAPKSSDVESSLQSAQTTLGKIRKGADAQAFADKLKQAKAVLVVSSGVSRAVVLARDNTSAPWAGPAFYKVTRLEAASGGAGGAGFSAGKQTLEMVILAMNDKALNWLMAPTMPKQGGVRVLAAGTPEPADALVFRERESAKGVADFGLTVLSIDANANQMYYGQPVKPADILLTRKVSNSGAAPLLQALSEK